MSTINTRRVILSPTETKRIKNTVAADAADRVETDLMYPLAGAKKDDSIKRMEKALKDGEPDSISSGERNLLEKRAKVLKSWLEKKLVPRSHTRLMPNDGGAQSYEFRKAVNALMKDEMSTEFQQIAQEYKNIMRQLGRPEEANLESIRPNS